MSRDIQNEFKLTWLAFCWVKELEAEAVDIPVERSDMPVGAVIPVCMAEELADIWVTPCIDPPYYEVKITNYCFLWDNNF